MTGEIIAENARLSAWPLGTSKTKYTYTKDDALKNPKQYNKYFDNLEKAFPDRAKK